MKRILFLISIILISLNTFSQDIGPLYGEFMTAYKASDTKVMTEKSTALIDLAPDNYAGYVLLGFTEMAQNKLVEAEKHVNSARHMNPFDSGTYSISSYLEFLKGNVSEAEKLMHYSFQIAFDNTATQTTIEDVEIIESISGKDMTELKEIVNKVSAKYANAPMQINKFYQCQNEWSQGKNCNQIDSFLNYLNSAQPANTFAKEYVNYLKGILLYNGGKYTEAETILRAVVSNDTFLKEPFNAYSIAQAHFYLTLIDQFNYDYDALYSSSTKGLKILEAISYPTLLKCQLLQKKSFALSHKSNPNEELQIAQNLLNTAKKINSIYFQAQANNTIGGIKLNSTISSNRLKAYSSLETAYQQAKQLNDEVLMNTISGNYSISLWQNHKKSKAIEVGMKSYEFYKKNKDYPGAQLSANNLGFMSLYGKDYESAAKLFSKAVDITEKFKKGLSTQQQLAVMNEHTSAYGGLILSYQKLNNVTELFKAQDLNRSRLLRERLDTAMKVQSVSSVQQNLNEDEIMLYYSLGSPGEMVVSVITNNEASISHSFPIESWLRIKKQFINKIQKKPSSVNMYFPKLDEEIINGQIVRYSDPAQGFKSKDFELFITLTRDLIKSSDANHANLRNSFLKHWYQFLIKPVESKIAGKKTLIISGEGLLNYIPFETFIDANNKYLIETHNVKYIPSATIWASLQNRNYSDSRKPLLAMGGATYQNPNKSSSSARTLTDFMQVKSNIAQKIKSKSNLKEELKALGFGGANYLPGTLREVENLGKIVPNATILTDQQMKESDLKRLNVSGELAKYKYIHIATHGFALDNIPNISGVMMTQPSNGDGNEDMFLLAPEIADLTLKADLAVLSACDTGLGKIYGGEGVNGLNSALLVAGANNTLLSLWPVNDAGTMIFMSVLYDNMYNKKQSVEDASNNAKRSILSGEYGNQFKSPQIWAPFVLNGL